MARYGVSRATVRQALGSLIAADLLEVRRGLGTFVRSRPVEHALGGFYTFSREIERHGMVPGTRVLDVRVEAAGERVGACPGYRRSETMSWRWRVCGWPMTTRS